MKRLKRVLALLVSTIMIFGMTAAAFADEPETASITINATENSTGTNETKYNYYEFFRADILELGAIDPETGTLAEGEEAGTVAYYLPGPVALSDYILGKGGEPFDVNGDGTVNITDTTLLTSYITTLQNLKVEGHDKKLFKITASADLKRYNVELLDDTATGEDVAKTLFANLDSLYPLSSGQFQMNGDTAVAEGLEPGYYLVTSTLGTKLVLQTLGDVTVNTKNEYVNDLKVVETASVTIGESATYYIKVYIPETVDTELDVIVHDKLAEELKFNDDVKVCIKATPSNLSEADSAADFKDLSYSDLPRDIYVEKDQLDDECTFEIVIDPTDYLGKYLVFKYSAELLATATASDAGFVNEEYTTYSDYTTVPSNPKVKTYEFEILKTDGTDKLDGAIFRLYNDYDVENNKPANNASVYEFFKVDTDYRLVDNEDETDIDAEASADIEINSKTDNKSTVLTGFGAGTYYLVETTAPKGYNLLTKPVIITIEDDEDGGEPIITATLDGEVIGEGALIEIMNQAGVQLPATGGMGTTVFYILGSILVIGAGIILVARKRMASR